jgi:hypothetical protein
MALRAYPNPERVGCPGRVVIEEVASFPLSSRHPVFQEHISRCSPCLAELLEIRGQNYEQKQRANRIRWLAGACIAASVFAAGVFVMISNTETAAVVETPSQPSPSPYAETARLDLRDQPGQRSDRGSPRKDGPHELPPRRLNLSVVLPFGSPPGRYDFGVFRQDKTTLTTMAGDAEVSGGTTMLFVRVDLSAYDAGQYLVAFKRPIGDWTFHQLTIR